jgi:hypothetical protein
MNPRRILVIAAAASILSAGNAAAQVQNELQGRMAVMSEVVAGVVATMIEFTGQCDPASRVTYSGNYTANPDMADIAGTYAGMPVQVHIDSFFDVFTELYNLRYTGVGAGVEFTGDGQASLSAGRDIMIMSALGTNVPWDVHVIKNYKRVQVAAGIQIRDDGLVVITRQRRPIAKYKQTSVFQLYPPFRRTLTKTRIAPGPGCVAKFTETLSSTGDSVTGRVVIIKR